MIFLHSPWHAIAYGSTLDNNPTYADYTVNCQKKCSHRSRLRRRKMLNMTRAGENHSIAFLGKIQFQRPSQLMT